MRQDRYEKTLSRTHLQFETISSPNCWPWEFVRNTTARNLRNSGKCVRGEYRYQHNERPCLAFHSGILYRNTTRQHCLLLSSRIRQQNADEKRESSIGNNWSFDIDRSTCGSLLNRDEREASELSLVERYRPARHPRDQVKLQTEHGCQRSLPIGRRASARA